MNLDSKSTHSHSWPYVVDILFCKLCGINPYLVSYRFIIVCVVSLFMSQTFYHSILYRSVAYSLIQRLRLGTTKLLLTRTLNLKSSTTDKWFNKDLSDLFSFPKLEASVFEPCQTKRNLREICGLQRHHRTEPPGSLTRAFPVRIYIYIVSSDMCTQRRFRPACKFTVRSESSSSSFCISKDEEKTYWPDYKDAQAD